MIIRENSDITSIMIHHTGDVDIDRGAKVNNDYSSDGYFGSPYDIYINKDGKIDLTPRWILAVDKDQYLEDVSPIKILSYNRHYSATIGDTDEMKFSYAHIAVAGDFDGFDVLKIQLHSLIEVLRVLVKDLDIDPRTNLFYHSDKVQISCPGLRFPSKNILISEIIDYFPGYSS